MNWTAVLPLKQGTERKSRLASRLSPQARAHLSDYMAEHVLDCLRRSSSVRRIILLSPSDISAASSEWRLDRGRGLNTELTVLRAELRNAPMLVVHGDLPLIDPKDIEALIEAAAGGYAIAPDRHGSGTNALALNTQAAFGFAFGADSYASHQAEAGGKAAVVRRRGLSLDVDTPDDLDAAVSAGMHLPDFASR